ncbi:hypothetical protein HTZ89_14980 [Salmonella enterica subsp. diarizonae serovar 61:k:1,5,(7)]|nr:hypothetical protein HTZ89_14980 [Salmonella enterica subsp. diarizonae serovar 61:k:1,5,(7)]
MALTTSAIASGNAPITLTTYVVDQYGKASREAVIDWTADNAWANYL